MADILGIDVSSYQGKPDWIKVKNSGIKFAILRIHQKNGVDSSFEHNYSECTKNNIPIGGYKFSYAKTVAEAEKEAKDTLAVLNGRKLTLPIFYDLEWNEQKALGSKAIENIAIAFLNKIAAAGYKVGIYSNVDWYNNILSDKLKKYDLWIARYPASDNGNIEERLRVNYGVGWQFSSKGNVPGISGNVDMNVFYKDYSSTNTDTNSNTTSANTSTYDKLAIKNNAINALLAVAQKEVGYLEKKSNSQLDSKTANAGSANYTKYWRDVYPAYQGQPWCACFDSWCFMKAFGLETAKKLLKHWPYVYCPTLGTLFTKKANPKVGDIVIFYRNGTFAHTGIVTKVDGDRFYTIEGNTSGGSTIIPNGGGVCAKSYLNSQLPGTKFCTPDYSIVTSINSNTSSNSGNSSTNNSTSNNSASNNSKSYLSNGDSGENVKTLQTNLKKLGYTGKNGSVLSTDGVFGTNTEYAVKKFQADHKLEVDGKAGTLTQNEIVKAINALNKPQTSTYKKWTGKCIKNGAVVYKAYTKAAQLREYPKLNAGNLVDVVGLSDGRYKVIIAGKYTGYVFHKFIDKPDADIPTATEKKYPFTGKCVCTGLIDVYENPVKKTKLSSYPNLANTNLVDVLGVKTANGIRYYKIRIAGEHIGYVLTKYIRKA